MMGSLAPDLFGFLVCPEKHSKVNLRSLFFSMLKMSVCQLSPPRSLLSRPCPFLGTFGPSKLVQSNEGFSHTQTLMMWCKPFRHQPDSSIL